MYKIDTIVYDIYLAILNEKECIKIKNKKLMFGHCWEDCGIRWYWSCVWRAL